MSGRELNPSDRTPNTRCREAVPIGRDIVRFVKCSDPEQMQRDNILAALEYTRRKIYGPKGAAEMMRVNPSTLSARVKSFGTRRVRD